MEYDSSAYQSLKILLAEYIPIDRDILHVVIGLLLAIVAVAVARSSMRLKPFLVALAIACLLGVGMEVLDRSDDLQSFGVWRWRESAADILRTILVPAIGVLIVVVVRRNRKL